MRVVNMLEAKSSLSHGRFAEPDTIDADEAAVVALFTGPIE